MFRRITPSLVLFRLTTLLCILAVGSVNAETHEAEPSRSYIVQGLSMAKLVDAVETSGGKVTHRLSIIEAVGADLTDEQKSSLQADGIQLTLNGKVEANSVSPGETMRDEFSTIAYDNNDGSVNFASAWTESGDDGTATTGKIKIRSGKLILRKANRSIERRVDPSSADSASLTVSFQRNLVAGEYVAIDISANGSAFVEIDRLEGAAVDSSFQSRSFDIAQYASSDTTIRSTANIDGKRKVKLNSVEIS